MSAALVVTERACPKTLTAAHVYTIHSPRLVQENAQDKARQRVAAEEETLRRLVARQTALINSAAAQQRRAALQVRPANEVDEFEGPDPSRLPISRSCMCS